MRQITEHTILAMPDAMKEIEEMQARLTWRPIMTAPHKTKILVIENGEISIAEFDGDWWLYAGGKLAGDYDGSLLRGGNPLHWMPLPAPPNA